MKVKKGPWIVTGTKIVYKNPWISVREDSVIRPDKKPGIFGVVDMIPGVTILPIDEKGNVYLTKEYHYGVGRITIEAISGGIKKQETRLNAAKRELEEETGLKAKKWTYLGIIDPFTTAVVCPNYIYLAQDLFQQKARPDGTEKIEIIKVPLEKTVRWLLEGKITHAGSVISILRAEKLIG
jgi:ADP-ribose pyrophosphatase